MVGNRRADEFGHLDKVVVGVAPTKPVEHHLHRGDGGNRVHDALSSVFGRRAVYGLEHRVVVTDVGRTGHAHATLEDGSQVGGNVAEHVAGHDHVVVLWISRDPLHERVDVAVVTLDVRIALAHLVKGAPEQLAAPCHVGFVHAGDATDAVTRCTAATGGDVEAHARNALRAEFRDGPRVVRDFTFEAGESHLWWLVRVTSCRPVSATAQKAVVEPFRVLAKHDHVDHVVIPHLTEGAVHLVLDALVKSDGADIGVQVESRPHAEDDAATCEVTVLQTRTRQADGAEENGVGFVLHAVPSALFPLQAGLFPNLTSAGDVVVDESMCGVLHHRVQNADGFWCDLTANTISGEHGNAVVAHGRATETSFLNGTPVANGPQVADSRPSPAPYFIVRHEDLCRP